MVKADRAERIGLVSEVFGTPADMQTAAVELADEMLMANPLALRLTKEGLSQNIDAAGLEAALAIEDRQQALLATAPSGMMATLREQRIGSKL